MFEFPALTRSGCLATLPITRPSALMSHRNYFYDVSRSTVKDAKRKSGEDDATCPVLGRRPSTRCFKDLQDDAVKFEQKCLPRHRASLRIPRRGYKNFFLSFRMEPDFKTHLGAEKA